MTIKYKTSTDLSKIIYVHITDAQRFRYRPYWVVSFIYKPMYIAVYTT